MPCNTGFKNILIVGLGLIGGSFAKSFKSLGITVYGYDKDFGTLAEALKSGVFDGVTDEFDASLVFPADLIYICLPVKATVEFIKALGEKKVTTPVTDGGSVKTLIVDAARMSGLNFCGGHPIKGKETSGFGSSESGLFQNAKHVLTPFSPCDEGLSDRLKILHELIGMNVSFMDAETHDNIFALISHLPHFAAFCLMDTVSEKCNDALSYAGGGFMDFTRIAASDPVMWADIFSDNREYVLQSVTALEKSVKKWKNLIETDNYSELKDYINFVSNLRRLL